MSAPSVTISVIIPALNESENLPLLLSDLNAQIGVVFEIIVVDGGSTDNTCDVVQKPATLIRLNKRNRAKQLNTGAAKARGKWFLFVHADCRIRDPLLLQRAHQQIAKLPRHAGHFPLKFEGPGKDHSGFRYLEAKSRLNRPNTTNGDQGFLVSCQLFDELGGFDESLPFLEDQRFAEKLRATATWVTLEGFLETSTRRFEAEGFGPRYTLMAIVMGAHTAGLNTFFEAARPYVTHDETRPLDLRPFLTVIRQVTGDLNPQDATLFWLTVGRFIRENAWQIALFLDVYILKNDREEALLIFDTHIAPRLECGTLDAAVGALTSVLFRQILPAALDAKKLSGCAFICKKRLNRCTVFGCH